MRRGRVLGCAAAVLAAAACRAGDGGSHKNPDAGPAVECAEPAATSVCDLTGSWIVVQVTVSEALGAPQKAAFWTYHEVLQTGESFTIVDSLNCSGRVTGTTTVTYTEASVEAIARLNSRSVGRCGTYRPNAAGDRCELALERLYLLDGANRAAFLDDHWQLGDPPVALVDLPPLPTTIAEGMEDWDQNGIGGVTLTTGFGDRYEAARNFNEQQGVTCMDPNLIGGPGSIDVTWDFQASFPPETSPLLATSGTPINPGWAYWLRVDRDAIVVADNPLATCRNVARTALEALPDP
jgi:hypothetical protein